MNDQPAAADFIQASRVIKLTTPLGDNVVLPERASIVEGVNRLFEIEIAVRSKKDIAPADLIGKLVDVELEVEQGEDEDDRVCRCWNGLVTELHEGPAVTRGLRSYHLVLRPNLWLLSQTRDSRIWMDRSTLDVLDTLMSEHGLKPAETGGVINPEPPLHYSAQFNESELRYLLRRFEQSGYFWWFSHEKGSHTLHVANHVSGWLEPSKAAKGEAKVRLAMGSSDRNHIREWTRRFAYVPGVRTGADWNYETFGTIPLNATPSLIDLPGNEKRELFEWPARAMDNTEAERAQKLRSQASEADHERVTGSSTVRVLDPGRRFTPYDVANPEAKYEEHVIVAAEHTIVDRSYETDASSEPEYKNRFEAVPSRVPLTPHRTTPKPKIEGLQVAVVAGPAGEEIHCDSDGCVKLWFPWQRHRAKKDGTDTKWIRVATNWAGQGWGGQVIPRIGMEVLVAFLDSDPDRPLVVGLVPNPRNKVPYPLPANKTKSVFKTNTHKGKSVQHFNELTFEDEKGREEIYIHGEKDMNVKIEDCYSERIDRNFLQSVGNNMISQVDKNRIDHVNGTHVLEVGSSGSLRAAFGPDLNRPEGLGHKSTSPTFGDAVGDRGDYIVKVDGNRNANVGENDTCAVAGDMSITTGKTFVIRAESDVKIDTQSGLNLDAEGSLSISSSASIQLSCGSSSIVLMKDGTIIIRGQRILTKADGEIDTEALGPHTIRGIRVDIN